MTPRQLGPYRLLHRIGSGGMAEVWMGQRNFPDATKTVAIKMLAPNLALKSQYRKMFLEEARLSMLLSSSATVHVFDRGEEDGICYIAMEWVDGMNLAQLAGVMRERGERLPLHVCAYIIGELLRGLDHVHNLSHEGSSAIVHRDVSPQNVMLSVAGEVKLTDFGVARFSTEETDGAFVKGKLRYMPPEQLKGNSREPTLDLFAVGGVFHELVEGQRFRGGVDNSELLAVAINGEVPPLTRDDLPRELMELIEGLLQPKVSRRIGSARAALRMLGEWPGYRDAKIELESYVLRFRNHWPEAPSAPAQRFAEPGTASSHRPMSTSEAAETSPSGRHLLGLNAPTTTALSPVVQKGSALERTVSRRRRRAAAVVLAALALLLGSFSVLFAVVHEDRASVESKLKAIGIEPLRRLELARWDPAPSSEPGERQDGEGEGDGDGDGPTPDAPKPDGEVPGGEEAEDDELVLDELPPQAVPKSEKGQPEKKERPKPKRERVEVEFVPGRTMRFAYLKVGGKQIPVDRLVVKKIVVGRPRVYLRTNKSEDWRRVGRLELEAGKRYRVQLVDEAHVRLTEIN